LVKITENNTGKWRILIVIHTNRMLTKTLFLDGTKVGIFAISIRKQFILHFKLFDLLFHPTLMPT